MGVAGGVCDIFPYRRGRFGRSLQFLGLNGRLCRGRSGSSFATSGHFVERLWGGFLRPYVFQTTVESSIGTGKLYTFSHGQQAYLVELAGMGQKATSRMAKLCMSSTTLRP